jgi:hypothetical protein
MATPARITARNLLNTVVGFSDEIRNDPWGRSYWLAISVIKHFLGEEWIATHLEPKSGASGFLQPDIDAPEREIQFFRAVDLDELLFNLQHIEGFDGCVARLKSGDIQPSLAELDVARMLYINDHQFWFVEPEGKAGEDFDFRVIAYGVVINVEAKCNLETPDVSFPTIKNSLHHARTQLPKGEPGIVFVKLPSQWVIKPEFAKPSVILAQRFLKGTTRVASVAYYGAPFHFVNGNLGQGHVYKEIPNPRNPFGVSHDWSLLNSWVPPNAHWNKMPAKWLRLVFFPAKDPPA